MNDRDREARGWITRHAMQPRHVAAHARRSGAFRAPLLLRALTWYCPLRHAVGDTTEAAYSRYAAMRPGDPSAG